MAEVTVRIKFDEEFTVFCDGSDSDEVLDDIVNQEREKDRILSRAYENMTIVSAEYDEAEEMEDDDEDSETLNEPEFRTPSRE